MAPPGPALPRRRKSKLPATPPPVPPTLRPPPPPAEEVAAPAAAGESPTEDTPVPPPPAGSNGAGPAAAATRPATTRADPAALRPGRGWYAVPAVLTALVLATVGIVLAWNWERIAVLGDTSAVGPLDQGVPINAHAGERFLVYTYADSIAIPDTCTVHGGQGFAQVPLETERGWLDAESTVDSSGMRLHWAGAFEAPINGAAVLTCPSADLEGWVYPDDSVVVVLGGTALAAVGGLVLAIAVTVLVAVLRARDRRRWRRTVLGYTP